MQATIDPLDTLTEAEILRLERESIQSEGRGSALYPLKSNAPERPQPPQTELSPMGATVQTIQASKVKIALITWLWFGYLAKGKLHILCGRPGAGKTTLGLKLAATITTGESWPDGSESKLGNVVIWSSEDDPADTLLPRLIAAGANTDKVYFINGVTDIEGKRAFDPASDMEPLRREIRRIGNVKLLVIDPIVSAVTGDDHKNASVRRSLQPLADLAMAEGVAVLGISHFSKNSVGRDPVDRVTGSLAYGAAGFAYSLQLRRTASLATVRMQTATYLSK